jgi:hypothetical protein
MTFHGILTPALDVMHFDVAAVIPDHQMLFRHPSCIGICFELKIPRWLPYKAGCAASSLYVGSTAPAP